MNLKDLMDIGLNKNESLVYLSLIKYGVATAHKIIQDTKFHKTIVYDNLEKLVDKGLVTFVIENKIRKYSLASSDVLITFLEDQEKEIQRKKECAKKVSREIAKASQLMKYKQESTIYRGISGVKTFYADILTGGDYVVFGAPGDSLHIMGEVFWKNFNVKRVEQKIKVRMIFNPSIKEYGEIIKGKFTKIRYFERDFEPLTETHIQGDKVGIIVWTNEPMLFLIQDKSVAESYLQFFEKMWLVAK